MRRLGQHCGDSLARVVLFGGMQPENTGTPARDSRFNALTLAAIGALACIAADMVHEGLGHGIASWLVGDRILVLSTVALQNSDPSRLVSGAGTTANLIVGAISLLLLRRTRSLTPPAYFLWAFGAFNLFNVGYLVASACMNSGDWAAVIGGLSPPWLWRSALALVGITAYVISVRWVASFAISFVNHRQAAIEDGPLLVWPAYLSAGVVLTVASIFNPIGPSLILGSGVAPSFGLNCGLLFVPSIIAGHADYQGAGKARIPFKVLWLIASVLLSGLFIGILGPGIHFS